MMKAAEPLPTQLKYDSQLVMDHLGNFYLCIPMLLEVWTDNQGPMFSIAQEKGGLGVIVLDLGVRIFMTGYDPSGLAIKWGENNIACIYHLCHAYNRIQSKQDVIHGKHSWGLVVYDRDLTY
jgi:hypothetical protein